MDANIEKGSKCPNCHNPFTKRDALRRPGSPMFMPVLDGCDVCHSLWKDGERSEAKAP